MNSSDKYYVDVILQSEVIVHCSLKEKKAFLKSIGAKKRWFQKNT